MFISYDNIFHWLLTYRYALLFPITVVEGPIISIIAGFLASQGYFNFFIAYAVVVAGDVFGDYLYYLVGRYGGKKFIFRYGRYVGIKPARVEQIENLFRNHTRKTLFYGKISHAFAPVVVAAAGLAKVPVLEFIIFDTIPTAIKSLGLVLLGYYFGQAYAKLDNYLSYATYGVIGLVILIILGYNINKRIQKKFYEKE